MSRRIFGLDIKEDGISAVLLTSSMKGIAVDYYKHLSLAEIEDSENKYQAGLEQIVHGLELKDAICVVAFSAIHVSFRNLQVPFKEPKRIKQILPLELEPAMPFPIDNAAIEFQVLELEQTAAQTVVMTATLETDWLSSFKGILKRAGMDPHILTVSGYHTAQCLHRTSDAPGQYVMIDMAAEQSTLYAVFKGQVCLIRSFAMRGENRGRAAVLSSNIRRTLAAAEEIIGLPLQPEKVFVNGVDPSDTEFFEQIGGQLAIPARPVDLAEDAAAEFTEAMRSDWQPQWMNNALALAFADAFGMPGFNFGRRPFAAMKQWMAYKKNIVQTSVLAAVVLLLVFGNLLLDYYTTGKQIAALDRRMESLYRETFPDVTRIQDPLLEMRAKLKAIKSQSLLSEESSKNIRAIDILDDISKRIPERIDVELTQLVIGPDTVLISGNTATFNMVDDIKNNLEKSDLFKAVTISSANTDRRAKDRITFKLKIEI